MVRFKKSGVLEKSAFESPRLDCIYALIRTVHISVNIFSPEKKIIIKNKQHGLYTVANNKKD